MGLDQRVPKAESPYMFSSQQNTATTKKTDTHISVVQIDVKYGNKDAIILQRVTRCDRDIVQQTKPLSHVRVLPQTAARNTIVATVMTRRPHKAERMLMVASEHRINGGHD